MTSAKLTTLALLALAAAGLAACNTVSGVGKDIGAAGDAITKTADDVKKKK